MRFLDQVNREKENWGTFLLTLALVFFTIILSGTFVESFAQSRLGFSLVSPPDLTDKNTLFALQLTPFLIAFVVLLLCVKYLHHRPIKTVFTSRDRFDWRRFFVSFGIWGGIMGALLVLAITTGDQIDFQFEPSNFFVLLLISLIFIPIQTSVEDVLFRGVLYQGLGGVLKNGFMAVLILGAVFGWLHAANPEVEVLGSNVLIIYILSGIFLGLLTHFDEGLELGMGYHVANNLFGSIILTNDWQAFHTDALFVDHNPPALGWESFIVVLIIQPILLFVFARIYKWKNIKEKFVS